MNKKTYTKKELKKKIKNCERWCKRMGIMEEEAIELKELKAKLKKFN